MMHRDSSGLFFLFRNISWLFLSWWAGHVVDFLAMFSRNNGMTALDMLYRSGVDCSWHDVQGHWWTVLDMMHRDSSGLFFLFRNISWLFLSWWAGHVVVFLAMFSRNSGMTALDMLYRSSVDCSWHDVQVHWWTVLDMMHRDNSGLFFLFRNISWLFLSWWAGHVVDFLAMFSRNNGMTALDMLYRSSVDCPWHDVQGHWWTVLDMMHRDNSGLFFLFWNIS